MPKFTFFCGPAFCEGSSNLLSFILLNPFPISVRQGLQILRPSGFGHQSCNTRLSASPSHICDINVHSLHEIREQIDTVWNKWHAKPSALPPNLILTIAKIWSIPIPRSLKCGSLTADNSTPHSPSAQSPQLHFPLFTGILPNTSDQAPRPYYPNNAFVGNLIIICS